MESALSFLVEDLDIDDSIINTTAAWANTTTNASSSNTALVDNTVSFLKKKRKKTSKRSASCTGNIGTVPCWSLPLMIVGGIGLLVGFFVFVLPWLRRQCSARPTEACPSPSADSNEVNNPVGGATAVAVPVATYHPIHPTGGQGEIKYYNTSTNDTNPQFYPFTSATPYGQGQYKPSSAGGGHDALYNYYPAGGNPLSGSNPTPL